MKVAERSSDRYRSLEMRSSSHNPLLYPVKLILHLAFMSHIVDREKGNSRSKREIRQKKSRLTQFDLVCSLDSKENSYFAIPQYILIGLRIVPWNLEAAHQLSKITPSSLVSYSHWMYSNSYVVV